jgi:hypothetical protein
MNLKFFSKNRRENLLQFRVVRVQANTNHRFSSTQTEIRAPFQPIGGESQNDDISDFFVAPVDDSPFCDGAVVIPRKTQEVYDLLVIAKKGSKLHLVTGLADQLGYFMLDGIVVAPQLPNPKYGL